ncbi:MAG TPA: M20/M25/M40 family metallo-hydrolase, partial [Clostridia bacterium]|nr:M20/M25/M40 family metallo-hydrolase [Clostridia bacterium]
HLDTVNGADEQFTPRSAGGRIYGRGACDTKGSVASMLRAVCELAEAGVRPQHTEIVFAGLMDEENDQGGSRALAASGLGANLAIVGEPTRLKIVTAHKGSLWLKLETRGKAAHGSRPELGRNAVHHMARIVDLLETSYAEHLRQRPHSLLGPPTISVGTITGGTQPNIVPDLCAIQVDRRTLPGETVSGVQRELALMLRKSGLRARISSTKPLPCMPLETDYTLPLVKQFLHCAGQRGPAGAHYFCDAAILAAGGIPSVVFGPGDIAQAHTAEEWIAAAEVEQAKNRLVRFLRALA